MTTDGRTFEPGFVAPGAAPSPVPAPAGWHLRRRHLWLVPALAIAVYANAKAAE